MIIPTLSMRNYVWQKQHVSSISVRRPHSGQLIAWVQDFANWVLEIVKKPDDQKGFAVLPRRWVVERTFAWFGFYRRLSKDYEVETRHSEAMIHLAMIHLMVRRLAKNAKI